MIVIRPEMTADIPAIRLVNERSFEQRTEADLVDTLRQAGAITLSLVAVKDERVIGHILFSPVTIESAGSNFRAVGLGPMAVLPNHQRKGVGSQLVRAGLDNCREAGHEIVIVLGHADYYPRFGFRPSKPLGIQWEHDVPEEVFMICELRNGALAGRQGTVKYHPAFNDV